MSDEILESMFPSSPGMFAKKPNPGPDQATREAFPSLYGEETSPPAKPAPDPERRESSRPPPGDDLHARVAAWEQEARADPEFGGARFDATIAGARSVIAKYGDQALKDALNQSGLGNHPALIRLLAKVAAAGR